MKRFFYYLGWTIVIGFIVYLGNKYHFWFAQKSREIFNSTPVVLYSFIFSIMIGMLLRLPKFLNEIKQNKQWTFDWIKFIAIGLPSLCILLVYVSMFNLPESIQAFIPEGFRLGGQTFQVVAGVVFGYILLASLKSKGFQ